MNATDSNKHYISQHPYTHFKKTILNNYNLPEGVLKRASTEFNFFCNSTYVYGYVKAKYVVARIFSKVRYLKLKINTLSST